MVVTRSQSRWLSIVDSLETEQQGRQRLALSDFPALALGGVSVRRTAPVFTGSRLVDVRPSDDIRLQIPALSVLPRRWVIERFVFGEELSGSLELGAHTSPFVLHCLERRQARRWASGLVQPR